MGVVLLIVVGGVLGWLAAIVLRVEHGRGILQLLSAGVTGALAGGLIVSPFLGAGNILAGRSEVPVLLLAALGAFALPLGLNRLLCRTAR